jgi:hypothetical protein
MELFVNSIRQCFPIQYLGLHPSVKFWAPTSSVRILILNKLYTCTDVCQLYNHRHTKAFLIYLFSSNSVWTQGLRLAGQTLYCLNHPSSPFCSGYFRDRVSIFALVGLEPLSSYFMFPLGWQVDTTMPSFFLLRWGLMNSFPGLAWNHDPPNLSFLSSQGSKREPPLPQ